MTPTIHGHRHFDLLPLSSFCRRLVGRLIRLCRCFGLAVLLLGLSGTGDDHFAESKKPMYLRPENEVAAVTFLEKWRSFTKKQYFCKCN